MVLSSEDMIEADLVQCGARGKVEMCPPVPSILLFASETIAAAFQRIWFWIFFSVSRFPGYGFCCSIEIEFRYGVLEVEISIPRAVASDNSSWRSSRALELPEEEVTVLNDSSHSSVSSGSVSGRV